MRLRDYQEPMIAQTRSHFRNKIRSVLLQLATGGGKTAMAVYMLGGAAKRHPVWFVVHRRELLKQSRDAFHAQGLQCGIVAAGFPENARLPIQVCLINTLANRWDRLPTPGLIVPDECHHMGARTWETLYERYPHSKFVGLSATPARLDGKGLGKYFQVMVNGPSVSELTAQGYLVPYQLIAPPLINTDELHTRFNDYIQSEVDAVMDKPKIVGDAVDTYLKYAAGRRGLVFCASVKASEHLATAYRARGVRAVHVDGETDPMIRDAAIRDLTSGALHLITSVDLFGEGLNVEGIEVVIQMRPTQSLTLHLQQIGRGLRPAPGKKELIIIDHVLNYQRLGLPDDPRQWSLEAGNVHTHEESVLPPPRTCPSCYSAVRTGAPRCKYCGTSFEKKPRVIEHVNGQLGPVDIAAWRASRTPQQTVQDDKRLETLVLLGKQRQYKDPVGWAQHVFNGGIIKKLRRHGKNADHRDGHHAGPPAGVRPRRRAPVA